MAKLRVYELAHELGVDSKAIMVILQRMGEFARSASSTIEQPLAEKVRQEFRTGRSAGVVRSVGPKPGSNPFLSSKRGAALSLELASEARAIFGDAAPLKWRDRDRPKGRLKRVPSQPETDAQRWARKMLPPDEMKAWCEAGLGSRDEAVAVQCEQMGLKPHHLKIKVDGTSVGARLRGGEPVASVVARLRAIGRLA